MPASGLGNSASPPAHSPASLRPKKLKKKKKQNKKTKKNTFFSFFFFFSSQGVAPYVMAQAKVKYVCYNSSKIRKLGELGSLGGRGGGHAPARHPAHVGSSSRVAGRGSSWQFPWL